MKKSHVQLNTKSQNSGSAVMKYNYGFGKNEGDENKEEEEEEENFEKLTQVANNLKKLASVFKKQKQFKVIQRDPELIIEKHIDYIKINFLGQFAVSNYFHAWYKNFGLEVVEVSNFGSTVLFAVVSELEEQFENFLNSIETLFLNVKNHENNNYSRLILYIDSFELLSSDDLIQGVIEKDSVINLKLADLAVNNKAFEDILENLIEYLKSNEIKYEINEELGIFEVQNKIMKRLISKRF